MGGEYELFPTIHRSCWACGAVQHDQPKWWNARWLPNERAHIVNKPRVKDVRVIVSLCSTCHAMQTNQTFPELRDVPPLSLEHLLFIKIVNDPWNFDLEFLNQHSVQVMPMPARLPHWYENRIKSKAAIF